MFIDFEKIKGVNFYVDLDLPLTPAHDIAITLDGRISLSDKLASNLVAKTFVRPAQSSQPAQLTLNEGVAQNSLFNFDPELVLS